MNRNHLAIYAALAAALLCGFVFGIEYTGRMAIETYYGAKPGWLATVQRVRWLAVGGFAVIGPMAAWLWQKD